MAMPLVAVVGRPNVGKSTFVNRVAQRQDAIVHEQSGVTRDRSYHRADWNGVEFMLVDTGGIDVSTDDAFGPSIRAQAQMAAQEADVTVLITDSRTGVTQGDEDVAKLLKRSDKPVFLVVNKMDDPASEVAIHDFWRLGLGQPWPVSSLHGAMGQAIFLTRWWTLCRLRKPPRSSMRSMWRSSGDRMQESLRFQQDAGDRAVDRL